MERWWAYRVATPQAAADAVLAMGGFLEDLVTGLGVAAKGFEGAPERLYVLVSAEATFEQAQQIVAIMEPFGESSGLSFEELFEKPPRPHLLASGPSEVILAGLERAYPGQIQPRRPV